MLLPPLLLPLLLRRLLLPLLMRLGRQRAAVGRGIAVGHAG